LVQVAAWVLFSLLPQVLELQQVPGLELLVQVAA
jgi:hypothetical protein